MPVMDGIESTLAIRRSDKHWSDILIIAVTADPQYQQLRLCKNIGMDDSLAKPVKLTGILEAFDRVLEIDRNTAPYKEVYKTAM
jgi:CheY-like chemotaxis protein